MAVLNIYLADLVHNAIKSRDEWMIPLNVLYISATLEKLFADKVRVRVFKFPGPLLEAIDQEPPDIIGVSNYIWNHELSMAVLNYAKERSPQTVAVMGGPNITETADGLRKLFSSVACDYYVKGDGEAPFATLVEAILQTGRDLEKLNLAPGLPGVWYRDNKSDNILLGPKVVTAPNLDTIPSPFQNGMVNEFFAQGLTAMIETNRGCPYHCTYCAWGVAALSKIKRFSPERVKADLDCCREFATEGMLFICDANFGLFKSRDMEIARYIRELHENYDWPQKVVVSWGQVTSDDALDVTGVLKGMCALRQAAQSMNPEVLKNIKRKNMSVEQWERILAHCHREGIDSVSELILMLPGETLQSYIEGVRFLFNLGVDLVTTYQLNMLEGAELNTEAARAQYGFKTRWRLLENAYGQYGKLIAIEAEEVVVETKDFSMAECLQCRVFLWLYHMSWSMKHHDLLLNIMASLGVNQADFLFEAATQYDSAPEQLKNLFERFEADARSELFETKEELIAYYSTPERIEMLQNGGFRKLNTFYSGLSLEHKEAIIDYYLSIAQRMLPPNKEGEDHLALLRDCGKFLFHRSISTAELLAIEAGEEIVKEIQFSFDFPAWDWFGSHEDIYAMRRKEGVALRFSTNPEQRIALAGHMKKYSGISLEYQLQKLHEPSFGIDKKHLMFAVSRI